MKQATRKPTPPRRTVESGNFDEIDRQILDLLQESDRPVATLAEEIGLSADHVDLVGRMPNYVSGSGYRIAPVLSVVRPGFALTLNEHEVDAAFEVPLRFLMDPANHRRDSQVWHGLAWNYFEMPYEGRYIWGVTAGIIRSLYERLYA